MRSGVEHRPVTPELDRDRPVDRPQRLRRACRCAGWPAPLAARHRAGSRGAAPARRRPHVRSAALRSRLINPSGPVNCSGPWYSPSSRSISSSGISISPISVSPSGPSAGIAPTAATPRSSPPRRTNQSDTQKSAHYLGLWEGCTENATVATALLVRPGRARPRPRAGDPVRDRRRQGAAQGDPRRLRRGAGAALRPAQGAQRARPPARARPARRQAAAAPGVGARRSRPRARAAAPARRRARAHATPAPPARCAKAWRRRSRSPGSASRGTLKRTLESTNPCESMIEIVRRTQRNVKRWSSGEMALRWTAAGMLEAERQFRTHHRLPRPRHPRRRDRARPRPLAAHTDAAHTATKEAAIVAAM